MSFRKLETRHATEWDWYSAHTLGETKNAGADSLSTVWDTTNTGAANYVSKIFAGTFTTTRVFHLNPTNVALRLSDFEGEPFAFAKVKHVEVQYVSGTGTLGVFYGGVLATTLFTAGGAEDEVEESVPAGSLIRHSIPTAAGVTVGDAETVEVDVTGTVTYNVVVLGT